MISGGGSGYGEGIARRFAQEGAKVLIADINEAGGKRVAQELSEATSFVRANVSQQEDWRRIMETAQSRYGRIDCLVNNAGTTYRNKVRSPWYCVRMRRPELTSSTAHCRGDRGRL